MSRMFESIKNRYELGWIRMDQLEKYLALKVITEEEFEEIANRR